MTDKYLSLTHDYLVLKKVDTLGIEAKSVNLF